MDRKDGGVCLQRVHGIDCPGEADHAPRFDPREPVSLVKVAKLFETDLSEDLLDDDHWDESDWELPDLSWCDNYTVHEAHVYHAINSETYRCAGMTAAELAAEIEATEKQCEHGLAEWLCMGPQHYPSDDRY